MSSFGIGGQQPAQSFDNDAATALPPWTPARFTPVGPRNGDAPQCAWRTPFNPSQTVRVCYCGRMNIYIDIDGPLIRNGQPTAHCFEFLRWAVEFHRPYWLTTRDAHGQHTGSATP